MTDFRLSRRDLLRAGAGAAALSSIPSLSEAAVDEMRVLFPGGSWKEYFERVFANDFANEQPTSAAAAIEAQAPGGMGSPLTDQAFDDRFGPSPLPVDQIVGQEALAARLA